MIATFSISKNSRWLRLAAVFAVVCAVVVSVLGISAVPARAAGLITLKVDPSSASVSAGESKDFTVTVENKGRRKAKGVNVAVSAPGLEGTADVTAKGCDGVDGLTVKCGDLESKQKKTFTVTVAGKADGGLDEGEKATGTIKVAVSSPNPTSSSSAVTIVGVKQVATGVKGQVTDLDDKGIPEVRVTATDAEGKKGSATTDGNGNFNISKEFAVGDLTLKYEANGYEAREDTETAKVGEQLQTTVRLSEAAKKDENPKKAEPSKEGTTIPSTDDIDPATWVLMALGVLLLLGGIVAIVMVMRRRDKDDGDDEPVEDNTPSIYKPNATQTGDLGVYDAAQRRPGMDAQTMLHNGPLYVDDDTSKPAAEPASSPGFGPSYTENSGDTTMRRPQSLDELPPTSRGTQPYSSPRDGYESSAPQGGDYGTSGFGQSYSEREREPYSNAPTERSGYSQPGNTPGGYGSDQSYGGNHGTSGFGQSYSDRGQSSYSSDAGNHTRGYDSSRYGGAYGSDAGYGRGQNDSGYGGTYGSDTGYGRGYSDDPGYGRRQNDSGQWSSEYPPQPPRQSRPRHYREDDEGQPRSW